VDDQLEQARTMWRSIWSRQKMCPACRALVERKETVCPLCGEPIVRGSTGALDRMVSLVIPDQMRYTVLIMAVNVVLFAMTLYASMQRIGGEPGLGMILGNIDNYTLVRFGAKYGPLIEVGQWWRFLTPIFLHGGLLHIGMNSWVLMDLGPAVEALYGRPKFLVLYIVAGIGGNLLSYWWHPLTVSIGASGAIVGLIGAMITYGYRHGRRIADSTRSMFIRWAIYVLAFGLVMPAIDNAAHIGGLITGMAFGLVVSDMPSVTTGSIYFWRALRALTVLLILGSFVMVGLSPLN
jgi:rhomboid protease GluP